MHRLNRRDVLRSVSAAALAVPASVILGERAMAAAGAAAPSTDEIMFAQGQREKTWALFRSYYTAKDTLNLPSYVGHLVKSKQAVYQDATVNFGLVGHEPIAGVFAGSVGAMAAASRKGEYSKLFHVVGDTRFGAVVEYVDPKNTFYSTNGLTIQTLFDLDNGLIARDTGYWDSRELGMADIVGPAVTKGVAFPLREVHLGGVARSGPALALPGPVQLAVGVTGRPSASDEMVSFVKTFHQALRNGRAQEIADFFTEDALYVNPLIHQGEPGYANYNEGIQLRGRQLIAKFMQAVAQLAPDCKDSTLVHIVGGPAGGGFEWKAGGVYSKTGVERTGLVGCTAIDLFGNRIQRMSVKFDTFHMGKPYDDVRSALRKAGVLVR